MNIKKTRSAIVAGVAGIAVAGTLTACGSSSGDNDGEYIRHDGGQLMSLVIDGDEVTHDVLDCQSEPQEEQSVGELNDDRSVVNWAVSDGDFEPAEGTFGANSDVVITDATVVIPYTLTARGHDARKDMRLVYYREGSDGAKKERSAYQQKCADDAREADDAQAGPTIKDGTYYAVDSYGVHARELVIDGTTATLRTADCDNYDHGKRAEELDVDTWTGTLSEQSAKPRELDVSWTSDADGSSPRVTLTATSDGGITADASATRHEYHPAGSKEAEGGLARFDQECGVPLPSS